MNTLMSVKGLCKKFGDKNALQDVNFDLMEGRIVGLMGPNGAGKTTLIKTLMQIYKQDAGEISIHGKPLGYAAKQEIAYMPDQNHLFPWMNIGDAIHYYRDMFPGFDVARAKELCNLLRLNEKERVKTLSKGTLERVQIMLTFARPASIYILDEPIAEIDPLNRDKILKIILGGVNERSTVILSTHLVKDVETIVDDVLFLHEGRLALVETAENIRAQRGMSIEECYLEVYKNV